MHPVLGRKLGRAGRSYAKIAAVGLAIGLAMALCASFAKYRSEQSFIDGAENGFGIDVILSWVQEYLDGCEDPRRAPNGKQLQGTDSGWRWRVGVYRILARIEDGKAVIEVVGSATARVSTRACRGYEHPKVPPRRSRPKKRPHQMHFKAPESRCP